MTAGSLPRGGPATRLLLGVVRGYRRLPRAAAGLRCRFYPSCSAYALTALEQYGAARGSLLTLRRLARCHPFHPGGVDHVPPRAGDMTATEPAQPRQGAPA